MSPRRVITVVVAVALGAVGAVAVAPRLAEHRAIAGVSSRDRLERNRAWAWLLADDAGRARALLPRLGAALAGAGDEAVADAAATLGPRGMWDWSCLDRDLLLRELTLRAERDDDETAQRSAVAMLDAAPLDLDPARLGPLLDHLLEGPFAGVRAGALEAACGWAGPHRGSFIADRAIRADDASLQRAVRLVLSWCEPPVPARPMPAPAATAVAEAAHVLRLRTDGPAATDALLEDGGSPLSEAVRAYLLGTSDDPRAARELGRMAEDGSRAAITVRQARARHVDEARAREAINDPRHDIGVRRMAAWRWDRVPSRDVEALLADDPAEPDGSVYAAALLAEKRLDAGARAARAEAWVRSFDDDQKRAGALLAALTRTHLELVARARDLEDVAAVRTTQRLALWAAGAEPDAPPRAAGPAPRELAHRALTGADGDFAPDTALCLLLAGDAGTLARLTRLPTDRPIADWRRTVQRRAWLIERFVPAWHDAAGRPVGGSVRVLELHFDRLDALRLLSRRRLKFDAAATIYTSNVTGAAASTRAEAAH